MKYYKFKNVKHSVILKFVRCETGSGKKWVMENRDYKGLMYSVNPDEVEEIQNESTN